MAIQKTKEPSKVDAALQRFAEMLIKRMEEMQKDWHKGWIGGGSMFGLPQNISGRTYEGSNAFLLFLHTAENGYKAPVYMTYGQLYKEGAHVLKGEKAVPVFKWGFSIKDKAGNKVTEEEFDNMTDDEKKECKRRPFLKIYPEFNIDQTNMSEVNKEKYDAVVSQFRKTDVPTITDGMYVNKAIDRMMEKQEWVCKIQYDKEEKGAYYSPAKDIVVLPTKAQFRIHPDDPEECFKDGQEYYGTALHEMAHSTGHPSRLDRLKPAAFGSPEYAKEELVAELTSAMVGNTLGFDRRISDNNVAYLQNWTSALRKEPKFIVTVMADVNKASRIIIENIDKQRIALGEKPLVQGALDGVEEKVKNEQQFEEIKADQKKEDPREAVAKEWDSLAEKPTVEMESGDVLPVGYKKEKDTLDVLITNEAGKQEVYSTNYDHDRSIEENVGHVWEELSNMKQYQAKEVNQESNKIEVGTITNVGLKVDQTFDYDVDRTIDANLENVYEQLSELPEYQQADEQEEELEEELEPESLDENISLNEDSKEKLEQDKAQIAQKFTDMPIPYFTMPNGEKLDFRYNQDTNNIVIEKTMDNGDKKEVYQHPYNHELTTAENMSDIYAIISQKPEYQKSEEKENVVAHEDSNVQTNVKGLAEDIAETGVPMEQAEKEAKNIVDNKQHEDFHEEEDKKQEQAEKEKQQQESKKEEDKPSKGVAHAAILLGALAAAKANDGVWMNKESKSNAEFIFSHTPVTAYNNIMMNLQSDQKGYRTNVFTSFNNAQKNGVAVKQGEKATPFNWTQWDYQNLTDKNDIISNKKYEKLSNEEKKMYGKHASRLTQYIYNIDQTTYPAVGGDQFVTLLKEKGAQQESLKPSTSASFLKQFDEIKAKHPDVIVIMRKDDSYEIYKSDAKKAAEATHLPVTKQEIEGKKIDTVSFSHTMLDVHLPNIIRAGHRVAVCDQLEDPKLVKSVPEGKAVLDRAYSTAKAVAKQEGIKYERVMVIQDAKYDKTDDKIEVSGMIDKSVGSERLAALQKANDIYRAVVAATGTENRLDRSGRNSLLPEDDAKHEKLVQELAAGVLMARQGLPATLSKESQKLIPYWERELKENPKMVGVIERDVNNAVETIDNLIANRKIDYKAIRGQLPPKMITDDKAENFSLSADLAKLPSIDTKEVVVVRDRKANKVDVILPAGASVEANNEVPGMRKDRISIALKKEGFDEVKFYNAGGSLGLNKPNSYFEGKDVSLNQLKQYQLVNHKTIEIAQQPKQENKVEIEHFEAIKDDYGRWAFYIKAKNEPQFSVYPSKEHMNKYFSVRKTPEEKTTHTALANKWYEVAQQHPDIKVDIISPHPAKDIDMSRIVKPTITKSAQDPKVKLVFATIDGERHYAPVTETQWHRMWCADDKAEYKKAVAAVVFEPVLRKGMESQQTQSEGVKETEKVEVKEAPKPEKKQEEQEEQSTSRGLHF